MHSWCFFSELQDVSNLNSNFFFFAVVGFFFFLKEGGDRDKRFSIYSIQSKSQGYASLR